MEEGEKEREPWELDEYPEGYDVYQYDAAKARKSQRVVFAVFAITLILYVWGMLSSYLEARHRAEEAARLQLSRQLQLGKK